MDIESLEQLNMEIVFQDLEDACKEMSEAIERVLQSFIELKGYLEHHG